MQIRRVARKIASAYDLIGVEADLERQWRQATRDWGIAGRDVTAKGISEDLKALDHDTWRLVCNACKAIGHITDPSRPPRTLWGQGS